MLLKWGTKVMSQDHLEFELQVELPKLIQMAMDKVNEDSTTLEQLQKD